MIVINNSNIDEVLFDYFEGNLSSEEKNNVHSFLVANPQFQDEYDAWATTIIPAQNIAYPKERNLLRKSPLLAMKWWFLNSALLAIAGIGILQFNTTEAETNYVPRMAVNELTIFDPTPIENISNYKEHKKITSAKQKKKDTTQQQNPTPLVKTQNLLASQEAPITNQAIGLIASITPELTIAENKLALMGKVKRSNNSVTKRRKGLRQLIRNIKAWENAIRIKQMNEAKKVTQKTKMIPMNEGF